MIRLRAQGEHRGMRTEGKRVIKDINLSQKTIKVMYIIWKLPMIHQELVTNSNEQFIGNSPNRQVFAHTFGSDIDCELTGNN
jgi:hypothetical protein